MKKVIYCIPTLNSFDTCVDSIIAVQSGSVIPDQIRVIDNSGDGSGTRYLHANLQCENMEIYQAPMNLGVGPSWNLFLSSVGDDYVIIANDDIEVHYKTIEQMVAYADTHPDQIFFAGSGDSGNAFSLFLLTQRGYKLIGPFDERFYPAYYEDNDYARRTMLAGYSIITVEAATYDHVGSSTLAHYTPEQMAQHHKAFQKNTRYYLYKWGGMPGLETLTEPQTL